MTDQPTTQPLGDHLPDGWRNSLNAHKLGLSMVVQSLDAAAAGDPLGPEDAAFCARVIRRLARLLTSTLEPSAGDVLISSDLLNRDKHD